MLNCLQKKLKKISGVTPKKIELEYRKNFVANCLAKGDNISSIAEKLNLRREPLYKFIQNFFQNGLHQENHNAEYIRLNFSILSKVQPAL